MVATSVFGSYSASQVVIVAGSFGLRELTELRVHARDEKTRKVRFLVSQQVALLNISPTVVIMLSLGCVPCRGSYPHHQISKPSR
jgi:hypothetical protein